MRGVWLSGIVILLATPVSSACASVHGRQAASGYEAQEDAVVAALAQATIEETGAPICVSATLTGSPRHHMRLATARQEAGSEMARLLRRHRGRLALFREEARRVEPEVYSRAGLRSRFAGPSDCVRLIVTFMRPRIAGNTAFAGRTFDGHCSHGYDDVALGGANGRWRISARGAVHRLGGVGPPCSVNARVSFPTAPNSVIYIEGPVQ